MSDTVAPEAGKYYRTRNGTVVGPMHPLSHHTYTFSGKVGGGNRSDTWMPNGRALVSGTTPHDLMHECDAAGNAVSAPGAPLQAQSGVGNKAVPVTPLIGRYYKTRNGKVAGPIADNPGASTYVFIGPIAGVPVHETWMFDGWVHSTKLPNTHDLMYECDQHGNPIVTYGGAQTQSQAQTVTVAPVAGGVYLTRDGRTVGPMQYDASDPNYPFFWRDSHGFIIIWTAQGHYYQSGAVSGADLVKLVSLPGGAALAQTQGQTVTFQIAKGRALVVEQNQRYRLRNGAVTSHVLPIMKMHYKWEAVVEGVKREWTLEGRYNAANTESPYDMIEVVPDWPKPEEIGDQDPIQRAKVAELERLRRGVANVFREDRGY